MAALRRRLNRSINIISSLDMFLAYPDKRFLSNACYAIFNQSVKKKGSCIT